MICTKRLQVSGPASSGRKEEKETKGPEQPGGSIEGKNVSGEQSEAEKMGEKRLSTFQRERCEKAQDLM